MFTLDNDYKQTISLIYNILEIYDIFQWKYYLLLSASVRTSCVQGVFCISLTIYLSLSWIEITIRRPRISKVFFFSLASYSSRTRKFPVRHLRWSQTRNSVRAKALSNSVAQAFLAVVVFRISHRLPGDYQKRKEIRNIVQLTASRYKTRALFRSSDHRSWPNNFQVKESLILQVMPKRNWQRLSEMAIDDDRYFNHPRYVSVNYIISVEIKTSLYHHLFCLNIRKIVR